jgi:hypothetical protein
MVYTGKNVRVEDIPLPCKPGECVWVVKVYECGCNRCFSLHYHNEKARFLYPMAELCEKHTIQNSPLFSLARAVGRL